MPNNSEIVNHIQTSFKSLSCQQSLWTWQFAIAKHDSVRPVSQKNLSWVCKQRATFSWRLLFILSTLSSSPSPCLSGFPIFSINHQIESFTSTWVISALPWEKEVTWARKTKSLKLNGWLLEGRPMTFDKSVVATSSKVQNSVHFQDWFCLFSSMSIIMVWIFQQGNKASSHCWKWVLLLPLTLDRF